MQINHNCTTLTVQKKRCKTLETNGLTDRHQITLFSTLHENSINGKKGKGSLYSTAKLRIPELIPVLGSQPAGDVSHKPDGRLPLLSARHAVTLVTLKRTATNFAAW